MPEIKITGTIDVIVERILDLSDKEYNELMKQIKKTKSDLEIDNILGEFTDDLDDYYLDGINRDFELYKKNNGKWELVWDF